MKVFYLFLIFLFTNLTFLQAQITSKQKDSVLYILPKLNAEQSLPEYTKLQEYYLSNNQDSAYYYASLILQTSQQLNDKAYIAKAYQSIAVYHISQARYLPAIDTIQLAIDLQTRNNINLDLAVSYKILAGIFEKLEEYKKSVEYSLKALKIFEENKDYEGIALSYNNLGLLNNKGHDYHKAIAYFKKALKIIDKKNIKVSRNSYYLNMSNSYKHLKNVDSTLYYLNKAIIDAQDYNDQATLANIHSNLANLYGFVLNKSKLAYKHFDQAEKFAKLSNFSALKDIYDRRGKLLYRQGRDAEALQYFNKTLVVSKKENSWYGLYLANFRMYNLYKKQKQWKKSLYHLEDFVDYQDSLKRDKQQVILNNLQSKYENEKNINKINQLKIKRVFDKKIKYFWMIMAILLLLVLLFASRSLYMRRKRNKLEKDLLQQNLNYKTKELTSQALLMMQKNKLLDEIMKSISEVKGVSSDTKKELITLKRKLKKSMHSEDDWNVFKHYFEDK